MTHAPRFHLKKAPPVLCLRSGYISRPTLGVVAIALSVASANGATLILHPSHDTSIYSENDNSNGLGALFAGRTQNGSIRRALLEFDLALAGIPTGAVIDSVSLTVKQAKIGPAGSTPFELRPILAAWGEATTAASGQGAPPSAGDATWNFRSFGSSGWTSAGGDVGSPLATALFGTELGVGYTFLSTPALVASVQSWLQNPGTNFGWMLKASNEAAAGATAREIASREFSEADQPTLTITYTTAPEPSTFSFLAGAGMLASAKRRFRKHRRS